MFVVPVKENCKRVQKILSAIRSYAYDARRYLRHSATLYLCRTQEQLRGRIIAHYHVIEKGLSLERPRPGFGKNIVSALIELVKEYQVRYEADDEICKISHSVLFSYYQFNLKHGVKNERLKDTLDIMKKQICLTKEEDESRSLVGDSGGVLEVSKREISRLSKLDFDAFVSSRHSIRDFVRDDKISRSTIEQAISIAIKTPSVCNRQTWRIRIVDDAEKKENILKHQNGNRGFGHTASSVLIVTSDLSYFRGISERNQCFIDGGMFAMSLVYALHSFGLGTCCLNWAASRKRDLALRSEANIKETEAIIMMIAVGNIPSQLRVAKSKRKKLDEIIIR